MEKPDDRRRLVAVARMQAGCRPSRRQTAWQRWRDPASEVQAAVTAHAKDEGRPRFEVEAAERTKARHPEPELAEA